MDHSGYRSYKNAQQERRNTVMGTSSSSILGIFESGKAGDIRAAIRYPDGTVGGSLEFHADWTEDGSVCAQLELRFEDQSSLVTIAEVGLADEGHEARRSWVLVEMEPRQSFAEPLRFRFHIPGKPRPTRKDVGNGEDETARSLSEREIVPEMRARCKYTYGCGYPVCVMASVRAVRQLADDGCISELVSLAAQSLHTPGAGT
jgi:hypothetical protein